MKTHYTFDSLGGEDVEDLLNDSNQALKYLG